MEPKVPVMSVAYYVCDICMLLKKNGFVQVLVFDDARNPLKKGTNDKRYKHFLDDKKKLDNIYSSISAKVDKITLDTLLAQQKKASMV